jgi:DUF1680 family protein
MRIWISRFIGPVLISTLFFMNCAREKAGDYYIQPVPFMQVTVNDPFWSPRMETNRKVTIPYAFRKCEETHRIANFAVAGGLEEGSFEGIYFNDSDVYKVIEGAAYALHLHPDRELEQVTDEVIDKIAAAQENDGYLYTSRTILNPENMPPGGKERWSDIRNGHELYCAGHMYEAAVAYDHATGKDKLLKVALKNAALIDSVFGPDGLRYPPGHQEIEIGLVKLYRHTGMVKYLDLARFFLDQRGDSTGHPLYGEYAQDHKPVTDQEKAVGHSVRAAYLYTGMADVAALTGNRDYIHAIEKIWSDVVSTKLYVTGGIGASGGNEGFGGGYHLPNSRAYCETCASIANAMWNHRLYLMTGDPRYMDIVERVIYNSFLSGISMRGDRFFYPNRLATFHGAERSPWFGCACCPSNIVRFIPSIPGYIYAHRDRDLFINLFIGGSAGIPVAGDTVLVRQRSVYPWKGDVEIDLEPRSRLKFRLHIRMPGWSRGKPVPGDLYRYMDAKPANIALTVNDNVSKPSVRNGYLVLDRTWEPGDRVRVVFDMPARRIFAHDSVAADHGRVAVERGPVVFCAEGGDQKEGVVHHLVLPDTAALETRFDTDLLGGVQVVSARGTGIRLNEESGIPEGRPGKLTLIPYYAWAHRGKQPMEVWIARTASVAMPLRPPTLASRAGVKVSFGRNARAVNDQLEPASSIDQDVPNYHWWPHKGGTEWIQYDFERPVTVQETSVYWFDNTGMGQCRVPESWRVLYRAGNRWVPVRNIDSYSVEKDMYNRVCFEPVTTRSVRLEIRSQENWAGGIHEWRIE